MAVFVSAGLLLFSVSFGYAQDTTTQTPPADPPAKEGAHQAKDLISTLKARGNFTTLVRTLKQTGLAETLRGQRAYTLFAPTDAAFDALPAGTLDSLSADQLRRVLRYHVVSERVSAEDAATGGQIKTAQGGSLTLEQVNGGLTVNGAAISEADIETSNGVIHVVDGVLMPKDTGAPTSGAIQEPTTPEEDQETSSGLAEENDDSGQ